MCYRSCDGVDGGVGGGVGGGVYGPPEELGRLPGQFSGESPEAWGPVSLRELLPWWLITAAVLGALVLVGALVAAAVNVWGAWGGGA
jgi:hypothetical protein